MTAVTIVDDDACQQLLRAGIFGRVAVVTPDRPEIVPVNYRVVDDAVVVRTGSATLLARIAADAAVCFEADLVDYGRWVGWSVVARGVAVVEPIVADQNRAAGPRPWVTTDGDVLVHLAWTGLSSRKIGAGWDDLSAMPGTGRGPSSTGLSPLP